jgi:hypothetical protein
MKAIEVCLNLSYPFVMSIQGLEYPNSRMPDEVFWVCVSQLNRFFLNGGEKITIF